MILYSRESIIVPVADTSAAGEARRIATSLASRLGFIDTQKGQLAIVVTEAATNLAQHAREGQIVLQSLVCDTDVGVEVIAIDKGPGMADVQACLQDGYSTAGTAGQGLGAISRLSPTFDLHSAPGMGTVLLSRIWARTAACPIKPSELTAGAISIPKPGEEYIGDSWAMVQQPGRTVCMVVDGLGHGPAAAEAATEARRVFLERSDAAPAELLDLAHAALRKTRGAAMALADINLEQRVVRYAGVGNIAGTVLSGQSGRSMVSYNGIVGHEVRKIQEFNYPWPPGAMLIMSSDGLLTQWKLEGYQGLNMRHPAIVAALLYRDFSRGRDDVTVLVAREP